MDAVIKGDPSYLVVVPVGKSGIAFLGDLDKFVPLGKKRVAKLSDNGMLEATIEFAPGEQSVTVQGWGRSLPIVAALEGRLGPVTFDAGSGRFRVEVFPGYSGTARFQAFAPRKKAAS
jgi:hypothetical protein